MLELKRYFNFPFLAQILLDAMPHSAVYVSNRSVKKIFILDYLCHSQGSVLSCIALSLQNKSAKC